MNRAALMYHDVIDGDGDASGFAGAAAARYKLDTGTFAAHLRALARSGTRTGKVTSPPWANDAGAMLTFDDGGASALAIGAALRARDMTGHFFVTTAYIDRPGFVGSDDITALRDAGHIVGSHSHTHPTDIARLDASALACEWQTSVDTLADILGEPVQVASVPGGFYSPAVAQAAAAAGIRFLFTSEPVLQPWRVGDCLVLGRYTLRHDSRPALAVALANGVGAARARQWLAWNARKPLKRYARPLYAAVRRRALA